MSDHVETAEEAAYSAKVIAESSNPAHMARMDGPDAWGIIHGCCGDTMEIYLRLDGGRIAGATFMTDGHESAIACANVLCGMVRGLSRAEADRIKPEDVIVALDGLPPAKVHCATLTVNTLKKALAGQGASDNDE
ncbi:MAG: iron-sulfur cluster assembly scaffold protein [Anaerolineae bacterium]|nr:iron-sulfur cluster assembly scaffold protein [Anaerolineae bacterium]